MENHISLEESGKTTSLFWNSFILPILRYKKMSYAIIGVSMVVTLVYCLVLPNMYTSTATILPNSSTNPISELGLLAGPLSEIGMAPMMQATENSSALYPNVLTSRLLQEKMLNRKFRVVKRGKQAVVPLSEYLGADNVDMGMSSLMGMVKIDVDRRTGVITLAVTTSDPRLSAAMVNAYLEELEDYNMHYRQSTAHESEQFIASRLEEVMTELADAEERLSAFLEQNTNYATSTDPILQRELARLTREVTIKETIFTTLTEKHELARLEAAKDVPIVQVLDRGSVPAVKTAPTRRNYMIGAFLGSLFISVILSLWFDISVRRRFRDNLEKLVESPDIQVNRIEAGLIKRAADLATIIEYPARIRQTDTVSANEN